MNELLRRCGNCKIHYHKENDLIEHMLYCGSNEIHVFLGRKLIEVIYI